jgi:hypothetical protein
VNKIYYILFLIMILCVACEFKLKPNEEDESSKRVEVQRYDRLEGRYLTTGDFSALQQMNTVYPMETRTLVEDVLQLGEVNDPEINSKFLNFYQDTTLQALITEAETQYISMDDINKDLSEAFGKLESRMPKLSVPVIYAQIGALNQSIIVGEKSVGISLDKYLGEDYPLYKKYYSESQRKTMERDYIVPDCLSFYLLSQFPMSNYDSRPQLEKDIHMGKVMWIVNKTLEKCFFKTPYVRMVDRYMKKHHDKTYTQLLESEDYSVFK